MSEQHWIPRTERINRKRRGRKKQHKFGLTMMTLLLAMAIAAGVWTITGGWGLFAGEQGSEGGTSPVGGLDAGGAGEQEAGGATDAGEAADAGGAGDASEAADADERAGGIEGAHPDERAVEPVLSDADGRVRLTFVGDVLLGSTVENLLNEHGYDYPYKHVREQLQDADVTVANLETPITDGGEPADKQYVYRSRPETLPALREAGIDLVGLANNHILDYGLEGLEHTLAHLDEHGIRRVGAGMDIDEAFRAELIETGGMKIAYLAFSQVVPSTDWKATPYQGGVADTYALDRPLAEIEQAAQEADLVVVLAHWGIERESKPNERQQQTAKAYIDAGADLVIGSHPHVLQSLQSYKGKWIAYSLGNFIFTTNASHPLTWESAILHADCDREGHCELELVPVFNKWAQPRLLEDPERSELLNRLDRLSPGVRIGKDGTVRKSEPSPAEAAEQTD